VPDIPTNDMETTKRFGDRVADYAKYRPRYPIEIVRILEREAHISPRQTRVCDVGSGTGISSELFLREGYSVVGVEPNAPMREESSRSLAKYAGFRVVDGTAEATTLASSSFDLVIAAQAFHWFDHARARAEFARILSPHGICAIFWNERRMDSEFLRAYEDALMRFGTDYEEVRHRGKRSIANEIENFFASFTFRSIPNHQDFDRDGLLGRARSSSYVAKSGEKYESLMTELKRLFDAHEKNGCVRFDYDTTLWFGGMTKTQESPKVE